MLQGVRHLAPREDAPGRAGHLYRAVGPDGVVGEGIDEDGAGGLGDPARLDRPEHPRRADPQVRRPQPPSLQARHARAGKRPHIYVKWVALRRAGGHACLHDDHGDVLVPQEVRRGRVLKAGVVRPDRAPCRPLPRASSGGSIVACTDWSRLSEPPVPLRSTTIPSPETSVGSMPWNEALGSDRAAKGLRHIASDRRGWRDLLGLLRAGCTRRARPQRRSPPQPTLRPCGRPGTGNWTIEKSHHGTVPAGGEPQVITCLRTPPNCPRTIRHLGQVSQPVAVADLAGPHRASRQLQGERIVREERAAGAVSGFCHESCRDGCLTTMSAVVVLDLMSWSHPSG